jgi:hypothetical protein
MAITGRVNSVAEPLDSAIRGKGRCFSLRLLLTVPCFLAGCGLADYQEQLERTQKRLKAVDEENALLAEPLRFPAKEQREGLKIFLRPPKTVEAKPNEKALPSSDTLFHFPGAEQKAAMPAVEVIAGALPKSERFKDVDRVFNYLKEEYLKVHANGLAMTREDGQPKVEGLESNDKNTPQLKFHKLGLRTEERPLWPAPSRAALPHFAVYNYEVYVLPTNAAWVVIIYKQLDYEATLEEWKRQGLGKEMLDRIPVVDKKKAGEQRRVSLGTLRIGPAAEALLEAVAP